MVPWRTLEYVREPSTRLRQIAFAGECPPREGPPDTREHAARGRPLPYTLDGERPSTDADEPARQRQSFATAVPAPSFPAAGRCAMRFQVELCRRCVVVHERRRMQIPGAENQQLVLIG